MAFRGRKENNDLVDTGIHRSYRSLGVWHKGCQDRVGGSVYPLKDLDHINQLGHRAGRNERGELYPGQAGANQVVDQRDLVFGGNELGFGLQSISRADLGDLDRLWYRHFTLSLSCGKTVLP